VNSDEQSNHNLIAKSGDFSVEQIMQSLSYPGSNSNAPKQKKLIPNLIEHVVILSSFDDDFCKRHLKTV
jgi:hypothetical protein